ncbi:hypothetical protein BH09VER1_BH09VER1_21080 [soil metagenome]
MLLISAFGIAIGGCKKPKPPDNPRLATTQVATPEIVVVPLESADPPKPPARLAPDGVVYLTKRISVTTDTSVIGVPEGTKVIVLAREAGRITGQVGGMVLDIPEAETSNDLDLITAILKKRSAEAAAASNKVDPLQAAGITLPEAKPPTVAERRATRVEGIKKIQELQTKIEDDKKQLAELNTLKIETIRKSLGKPKGPHKKNDKSKVEVLDPALDSSILDLKDSIEKAEKEIAALKLSLGLM